MYKGYTTAGGKLRRFVGPDVLRRVGLCTGHDGSNVRPCILTGVLL